MPKKDAPIGMILRGLHFGVFILLIFCAGVFSLSNAWHDPIALGIVIGASGYPLAVKMIR